MTKDEILELVAISLRQSASPSVNGVHVPDRYQASVTAEDLANRLLRAGLLESVDARHAFYNRAMPPADSKETWNSLVNQGYPTGQEPPR